MSDVDELKSKRICSECVGEKYLSDLIDKQGSHAQCHYCGGTGQTFTIEDMADRVETDSAAPNGRG